MDSKKWAVAGWVTALLLLIAAWSGNAAAHKRSLYDTLHTKRGERVMAKVICENPNKWYVEQSACRD